MILHKKLICNQLFPEEKFNLSRKRYSLIFISVLQDYVIYIHKHVIILFQNMEI